MYRNFNARALGVSGRQSELIELALTYRFRGMDINIEDFCKQADRRGFEHASRFIRSANIRIAGGDLPVAWSESEDRYRRELDRLRGWGDYLKRLGVRGLYAQVTPGSDELAYHENFEFHRKRFGEIADVLAPFDVRLAVGFLAPAIHRKDLRHPFIASADALVTLVKTIGVPNVGLMVDLWHWHLGGGAIGQLESLTASQIVAVRVADAPQGLTIDKATDRDRLLPGRTGVVPVAQAIELLRKIEFDGPVTVFPHPSQLKGMTRDQIVQRAAESIRAIWGERLDEPEVAAAADEETEEEESFA